MKTINRIIVAAGIIAPLAAGAQMQQPPGPGPLRPYVFPKIEEFQLPNGVKVVLVEKHTLPIIASRIILDAGSLREPAAKSGLANVTASLLSEGTATLTGSEIARRMDNLGAQFGTSGGFSAAFVDLTALKNVYGDALAIAAKTIIEPSFPENEFNRAKNEAIAGYEQSHSRTAGLAGDAFFAAAFDSTAPFSRSPSGTRVSLTGLTRNDVVNWARTMYSPATTTVLMVGDITAPEARAALTRAFGGWNVPSPNLGPVANPVNQAKGVRFVLVDRPASVQSTVIIGRGGFDATDPEYIPLLAVNHVLGGAVSSRLNTNLREKHAFTYGAFSSFNYRRGGGAFSLSTEVRTNATDSAIVEALNEYRRIVNEPVPQQELKGYVNNLVSGFPNAVQTVQGLQNRLQNLILWGLPIDFYATYRERLAAVTPSDVTRAAAKLDPNDVIVAVAGDLSKIEAPIRALKLGSVEVWDPSGKRVR
ncbi:MAG: insulinase family protein [Gemmatimonadaceae bacterium]|nr:insulinase family protein [Gemmatimonadaceae bacterium]